VDFTRAYTVNPVCTPTRASLCTGTYPSVHGAWTIGVKLPEDTPTLGDQLLAHGYDTTLVGKAHFQPLKSGPEPHQASIESQPTLRDLDFWRRFNDDHTPWYGFSHVETCRNHADEAHVGGHYAVWMEDHGFTDWADYYAPFPMRQSWDEVRETYRKDGQYGHWALPEAQHYTKWTGQRTIANIKRSVEANKPFYVWSSYHDPHPPYMVPEPWASMYDPADMPIGKYIAGELNDMPPPHQWTKDPAAANWESLKDAGGHGNHGYGTHEYDEDQLRRDMAIYYGMVSFMDHQIGQTLDALDELGIADNTLVVFSTDHGHYIGHHGLKAKGAFHYEQGIRLPFLVRYPDGGLPAGSTNDDLQSLVDLPATFLTAAGIEVPGVMQGVDQMPSWRGEGPQRDHVLVENRHQPTKLSLRTYIDERYKLTVYRGHEDWGELFDLQDDPEELHNRFHDPDWADVKTRLLHRFVLAEVSREPTAMPRVAGA
jgi:arylsulfatase A-like enzyme